MFWSEQYQTFSILCILFPLTWRCRWHSQVLLRCKAVYSQKYMSCYPVTQRENSTCSVNYAAFFLGCAEGLPSSFLSGSCYKCLHFPAHPPSASALPALSTLSSIHCTQMASFLSTARMNFPISGFAPGPQWNFLLHVAQFIWSSLDFHRCLSCHTT